MKIRRAFCLIALLASPSLEQWQSAAYVESRKLRFCSGGRTFHRVETCHRRGFPRTVP
jgi:hypothetical protein